MGTVGGNIANGSPIGDTPPALIAHGRDGDAAQGRRAADAAARGVLHRLRQAGPRARRVRRAGLRAAAGGGHAERGLQDHQAARRGHLGRGRAACRWRSRAGSCARRGSPSAAWRRRRSGRRRPRRRWSASPGRRRRSPRRRRRSPRTSRRSATGAPRPSTGRWRRGTCCRRFFLESARRAGAAGAGGGVMDGDARGRAGDPRRRAHGAAPRLRAQARHRGGRVHRRHRRAGRARCTPISGSRTGRMPRSCRSISTRCGRRRASWTC